MSEKEEEDSEKKITAENKNNIPAVQKKEIDGKKEKLTQTASVATLEQKKNDETLSDKSTKKVKSNHKKDKQATKKKKWYVWTFRITIVTFFLAAFFNIFSELCTSRAGLIVSILLTLLLIVIAIIFDGIGVSATSCDIVPLLSLASRKVPGSKIAIKIVKNSEKVSNICSDVIGDICGIISGSCAVAIVTKILEITKGTESFILTIIISSLIAAITVGGKSYMKTIAVKNSKEMVMLTAKILKIFIKEK